MRYRYIATIFLISLTALGMCACIGGGDEEYTIVDDTGREVLFEGQANRVVSISPAITEILFALGLDDEVVGVTDFCTYPTEAMEKEKVGGFTTIDVEKIISLEPDIVFGEAGHEGFIDQLAAANIPMVLYMGVDFETILHDIELTGQITGRESEAKDLVDGLQARIDAVEAMAADVAEKKTVFFILWNDPLMSAGPTTFIDSVITSSGAINLAGVAESSWPIFDMEWFIDSDPDVILLSPMGYSGLTKDQLMSEGQYSTISAVINDRVYELSDPDIIFRAGPRIVDALEEVYGYIYG